MPPQFSVIIATYRRPQQLRDCLQGLVDVEFPRDQFEVIVVDDGGGILLDPIIDAVRHELPIRMVRQDNGGCGAARNRGAVEASGTLLAFLDDDSQPADDWLVALAAQFAQTPAAMVGGETFNALPDNPYSTTTHIINELQYEHFNRDPGAAYFLAGNNFAMPKAGFDALGGFDIRVAIAAEDRDFCDKWLHSGRQIIYNPTIKIYHAHPLTLASFWRQHVRYGQGGYLFRQVRAIRGSHPPPYSALRLYWCILSYGFGMLESTSIWWAVRIQVLLVMTQVAVTVGYIIERRRSTI